MFTRKHNLRCCLLSYFVCASALGAASIETNALNVVSMNLLDSLENNASVYVCEVAKRQPLNTRDRATERGTVELTIKKTIYGNVRTNLVLSYGFPRIPGPGEQPMIWPDLGRIGESSILCVVVPGAEDRSLGQSLRTNEAASTVAPVRDENDPIVKGMELICALYATQDTAKLADGLRKAIENSEPEVRDFAIHAVVQLLGKAGPDEAIKILKSRVASYDDGQQDMIEGKRLVSYLRSKFGHVEPWERMNRWVCRCLVTLAQSQNSHVREKAIDALAYGISLFDNRPDFRLQDGLAPSEMDGLKKIIDAEENFGSKTTGLSAQTVRRWLDQ